MLASFRHGLALFVALAGVAQAADLDRSLFIRLTRSLVKIEAMASDGGFALGTGVAVAPGRVVTNCHVTRGAQSIRVVRGGSRWPVESQFADIEHDVCLLAAPRLQAEAVAIGNTGRLKIGQPVGALGFEGGVGLQFRQGVIKALHQFDGAKVVQSTTAFTSGASGGGLFDDQGQLLGLLTFRLRGADANYFSVPVEWFAARITHTKQFGSVTPLQGPRPFWQRDREALPFFMQANSLEVDHKWVDLLRLTTRWANAEKTSAEPWLAQAKAYTGLARDDVALDSYRQALALAPQTPDAWFGIGSIHVRQGEIEKAKAAETKLRELNHPELAAELARQISALPRRNQHDPKV